VTHRCVQLRGVASVDSTKRSTIADGAGTDAIDLGALGHGFGCLFWVPGRVRRLLRFATESVSWL
jgi:hypothetical protein